MRTPSGVVGGRLPRVLGSVLILSALLIGLLPVMAFAAQGDPNETDYWKALYPHAIACYKYDPPDQQNFHGYLVDDQKAVVLNEFQDGWPGDHWEVLIVKSGNEPGNTGLNGQNVYEHPQAGVKYYGPLNGGGKQGAVSHWIVCKGKTPETTTTSTMPTTTSTMPTTTSTEASTTSTQATTTSTAPVDYCNAQNKPGGISLAAWLELGGNPDCLDIAIEAACGMVTGGISRNETIWDTWAVAFEEAPATYDLGNAQFGSMSFPEDHNGGSVVVAYYLVGPEADYGKISGEPNFWLQNAATIVVDTDCQEPSTTTTSMPSTTTTSEPTTTTSQPTTTTSQPTTTTSEPTTTSSSVQPTRYACDEETNDVVEVGPDDPGYESAKATREEAEDDCTEVLPTVVTTTPEDPEDELPFTGFDSDILFGIALVLSAIGATLLVMTRRLGDEV
ncbi:MAG TPA: hypothetical protein VF246_02655 [Acidimicrobiia bacterium]